MKINGIPIIKPATEILVFNRPNSDPIIFEIRAVLDRTNFDVLVPPVVPPTITKRGGEKVLDFKDANYTKIMETHGRLYHYWMILNSIYIPAPLEDGEPTRPEWEQVNLEKPDTWHLYEKELIDSGFSEVERLRLQNSILSVNSIDETKIREARDSFLASRRQVQPE